MVYVSESRCELNQTHPGRLRSFNRLPTLQECVDFPLDLDSLQRQGLGEVSEPVDQPATRDDQAEVESSRLYSVFTRAYWNRVVTTDATKLFIVNRDSFCITIFPC